MGLGYEHPSWKALILTTIDGIISREATEIDLSGTCQDSSAFLMTHHYHFFGLTEGVAQTAHSMELLIMKEATAFYVFKRMASQF